MISLLLLHDGRHAVELGSQSRGEESMLHDDMTPVPHVSDS